MAKTINLVRDLLVKITNVFRSDLFIVHNKFCIGGKISESSNPGHYICILSEDIKNALSDVVNPDNCIFIESIRNAKVDFLNNIEILNETESKNLEKRVDYFTTLFNNIENWDEFTFSEEEIEKLYKDLDFIYFIPKNSDSEIVISKSLFPIMKEKDFQNAYYHVDRDIQENLNRMIITYDFKYFQLYMEYTFIKMNFKNMGTDN